VPLTSHGEADARDAGSLIGQRGLKFDIAFTSNLERAWRTCAIVLAESNQSHVETVSSWRLNERHYGGKTV
jgi:2,3-bisphosphoglycerate-dependent phosphoglycerate mutase